MKIRPSTIKAIFWVALSCALVATCINAQTKCPEGGYHKFGKWSDPSEQKDMIGKKYVQVRYCEKCHLAERREIK